jgi:CRP-like cAMP-binding protein
MDTIAVRDAVYHCEIFSGFEESHLYFLIENGRIKHFTEDQTIYRKGEEANGTFCLIASGNANIISENGEILYAIGPGNIIGEIGTISPQSKRTITVRAADEIAAVEWDLEAISKELPGLFENLRDLARNRTLNWHY